MAGDPQASSAPERLEQLRPLRPRLRVAISLVVGTYLFGTFAYYGLGVAYLDTGEHWALSDCFYMTVISITTVGYGEIINVHSVPGGWAFTSFLVILGTGVEVYAVSLLTTYLVEGHLSEIGRFYKMRKNLKHMQDHVIVCGAGRVGYHVAEELAATGHSFVVIDYGLERLEAAVKLRERGVMTAGVAGDATDESILSDAGVTRAKGMVVTIPSDKETLFVVMAARALSSRLHIVASAEDEKTVSLLQRAGANRVVPTKAVGGLRLASEAIRPNVVEFLDLMRRASGDAVRFSEAVVAEGSGLDGSELGAFRAGKSDPGVSVVAVKKLDDGAYHYGPPDELVLDVGDTLILVGERGSVDRVRELAEG